MDERGTNFLVEIEHLDGSLSYLGKDIKVKDYKSIIKIYSDEKYRNDIKRIELFSCIDGRKDKSIVKQLANNQEEVINLEFKDIDIYINEKLKNTDSEINSLSDKGISEIDDEDYSLTTIDLCERLVKFEKLLKERAITVRALVSVHMKKVDSLEHKIICKEYTDENKILAFDLLKSRLIDRREIKNEAVLSEAVLTKIASLEDFNTFLGQKMDKQKEYIAKGIEKYNSDNSIIMELSYSTAQERDNAITELATNYSEIKIDRKNKIAYGFNKSITQL